MFVSRGMFKREERRPSELVDAGEIVSDAHHELYGPASHGDYLLRLPFHGSRLRCSGLSYSDAVYG